MIDNKIRSIIFIIVLSISISCSNNNRLKGTYKGKSFAGRITIIFDGKGMAVLNFAGIEGSAEYIVKGDRVIIDDGHSKIVAKILNNGHLRFHQMGFPKIMKKYK